MEGKVTIGESSERNEELLLEIEEEGILDMWWQKP